MSVSDSHLQQLAVRYPQRATCWQLRSKKLTVDRMPLLMGIVNVTPDSFSDGGRYLDSKAAIEHGLQLAEDGADILDIGGESTRPYADKISEQEELQRVVDVVAGLAKQTQIPISIDTSKAKVAEAAVAVGAEIINDVTGLEGDPAMLEVAARSQAGVCAMHMQGTPQTMQDAPAYDNVVEEILSYLRSRFEALLAAGIPSERICLDPGIGFGKTHQHNLTLLANAWRFHELSAPILVGHSRKGFLAKMQIDKDQNRTMATVGASLSLAANGIQILRVHDVLPVRQALLSFVAAGGVDGHALQLDENKKVDRT